MTASTRTAPAAEPTRGLSSGVPGPVVSVRELTLRYGPGCRHCRTVPVESSNRCPHCGTVWAVRDLDFDIGPGEMVGFVGESGSGKTTLLRCLHLDLAPTSGRIEIAGVGDLLAPGVDRDLVRRDLFGMVHQNSLAAGLSPHLAALSNVAERLLMRGWRDRSAITSRSAGILSELRIPAARHRDPVSTFSGGMQQRVQLGRALVDPPRVLLLDEPTTGLDPSVQADLLRGIDEVSRRLEAAAVIVSHDLDVVRLLADRVYVVQHGVIVEEGLPDQILLDPAHPYTRTLVAGRLS